MKFDTTTTAVAFLVLLAVLLGGTFTSGMPPRVSAFVSVGLVLFGFATLLLGVKHGEYRAARR